jgi:hypothetical protein
MSKEKQNPTAFPNHGEYGLTMRDYFAAAALPALLTRGYIRAGVVSEAYKIADKMMEVRNG